MAAAEVSKQPSPRPLFITEYSVGNHDDSTGAAGILTYVPRLLLHNTSAGASGLLMPIMSYWAFSDVFEEHCLDQTPYHGGWGLVK